VPVGASSMTRRISSRNPARRTASRRVQRVNEPRPACRAPFRKTIEQIPVQPQRLSRVIGIVNRCRSTAITTTGCPSAINRVAAKNTAPDLPEPGSPISGGMCAARVPRRARDVRSSRSFWVPVAFGHQGARDAPGLASVASVTAQAANIGGNLRLPRPDGCSQLGECSSRAPRSPRCDAQPGADTRR